MAAQIERSATTRWSGSIADGSGTVTPASGAFPAQAVSWARRTGEPEGHTSPEELVAAAHAACYAMAFSAHLGRVYKATPEALDVTSTVGFGPKDGGGFEVKYSHLTVHGQVPGLDGATFAKAAADAEKECPISNLYRNNAEITVDATLDA